MMSKNRLTLILLIALIAAFIVVWDLPPGTFIEPPEEAEAKRFPNTYLTNMHTREFDESGFLNFELNAELAEIFGVTKNNNRRQKARGFTRLTKPKMQFHDPEHPSWFADSNIGIANNDGEKFELRNGVNVWFTNEDGKQTRIKTVKLTIFPQREYAETDKPVTITTAEGTTKAIGMKLFFSEQRLQLLNQVKGYYAPN